MILYKCGTKVITEIGKIEAIVTCISIRNDKALYELAWFHNGEYRTAFVSENEFTVENKERQKIGFK